MENSLEVTNNQITIAESLDNFSVAQVNIVKNTVAKGTTNAELAYFLHVCQSLDMNPLNKEIWCYKDAKNNLIVFSGRDGFLSKSQKNPLYNGLRSGAIREKDDYSIDIPNGVIEHKITKPQKERGQIIYGYAIVFRLNGESTVEIVDFSTYNKPYSVWKTHPEDMIKKVAETHALKKAFGISGLQSEYDFDINRGVAVPINSERVTLEKITELYDKKKDKVVHEDQMDMERVIEDKEEASYQKVYKILIKL